MDIAISEFGSASRQQVGVMQSPDPSAPRQASFLLLRPMGQEAVRTAAIYRVLSDRLARAGSQVLRFDFHGTGNSPGEEQDQSMEGWIEDALAAHKHLSQAAPGPVHWFGMGLGANIMLRAALRASDTPAQLVAWEPIWRGADYMEALKAAHRDELARELAFPWARLLQKGLVTEPTLPGDILGFQVGQQLANDLLNLDPFEQLLAIVLKKPLVLTCGVQPEFLAPLKSVGGASLRLQAVAERTNWLSSKAMGTAIVPPDLPRTLLSTLH